jgi:hypothetical protein
MYDVIITIHTAAKTITVIRTVTKMQLKALRTLHGYYNVDVVATVFN